MKRSRDLGMVVLLLGWVVVAGPSTLEAGNSPKDGELSFPSDYSLYPTFLKAVQKPDAVRDLFINQTGATANQGEAFPNGSVLVMEIYNAKQVTDGTFAKGPDGMLVKGDLAKIFVMEKQSGWGKRSPKGLQNGDWVYSAFKPNGDRLDVDYAKCRSCHLPLGETKDFVHRYDEYFMTRGHHH